VYHVQLLQQRKKIMSFRPTADRVLVRLDTAESKTSSGFFIPEATVEKPHTGTVVSAGPGRTTPRGVLVPNTVRQGDKIMFDQGSGTPVKVNGEELVVVREDSVIALMS